MTQAFQVVENGQIYDYRVPQTLNLDDAQKFFSDKYRVKALAQIGRHVTGIVINDGKEYFLKLATTKGISILTQVEYSWNEAVNLHPHPKFRVPVNVESGEYNGLFYFLAEVITGEHLGSVDKQTLHPEFESLIPDLLDFADYIANLSIQNIGRPDAVRGGTPQDWFLNKTKTWLDAIPPEIQRSQSLFPLLAIVESGTSILETKPRHGDFTPWHLMKSQNELFLLDAEHALSDGVEGYDIAYLIQRVHTISNKPEIAQKILHTAEAKGNPIAKLKITLASRAIGGFLDAHLAGKTDFAREASFRDFITSL